MVGKNETIFDHDITADEIQKLWCRLYPKDYVLDVFEKDNDSRLGALSRLYTIRGDKKRGIDFANQIKDKEIRDNLLMLLTEDLIYGDMEDEVDDDSLEAF